MFKPGDVIVNQGTGATWTVTKVNHDGSLEVEGQDRRWGKQVTRRITRSEFYRLAT